MHILFEEAGIQKGDKIALCGRNLSRWGAAFFSILTYGAVAVPILHEFHPSQVHDIVNHSESKLLFVGDKVWPALNADEMPDLQGIISLVDYSLLVSRNEKLTYARENLNRLFGEKFPSRFLPELLSYHKDEPDELAVLNYTSGTTSNSKGVMLPYRALWSNCDFAFHVLGEEIHPGDKVLSMLPMAHMYGMAFEFTFEFMRGVHVNFLTKVASPTILMRALADIKPVIIIVVPLPNVFLQRTDIQSDIWRKQVSLEKGKTYLVEASSGTGKSSLCSFIIGYRRDFDGKILFDGRDSRGLSTSDWTKLRQQHISMLFQELRLFPELTAMENVEIKNSLTGFKTRKETTLTG